MADIRVERAHQTETGLPLYRLSWGAILAGFVIAMVVQVLLSMLGLAIGLGAVDFRTPTGIGDLGTGAAIWTVVTALISLFAGGLAAGHFAGVLTRMDGVMHGVLVWGLTVIVTTWAITSGVGTLLGGVFGAAGQTVSAAITGVTTVAGGAAEGVVAQPGQAPMSREEAIQMLQQRTGMSRQQAEQVADQLAQAPEQVQLYAEQAAQQAPQVATQVAETVSTAIWWILLAALLSLGAAAAGAAVTARE